MEAIYGISAFGEKLTANTENNNILNNIKSNKKICEECALTGSTVLSKICEGYQFLIAFSGELEGSEALILKLSSYGYHFDEKTDAETALFSYIHFGEDSKNLLFGKFSMIIYDSMRRQVFAYSSCVDYPLFYRKTGNNIFISSTLCKILVQNEENLLSPETLSPYLMGISVYPIKIFNNVFLLTPKSTLKIKNNKLSILYAPKTECAKTYSGNYPKLKNLITENFSEQEIYNAIWECVKITGTPLLSSCDFLIPLVKHNCGISVCTFSNDIMPFLEENNFYNSAVLKTIIPLKDEHFSSLTPEMMLLSQYNINGYAKDGGENLNTETAKKFLVPLRRILLGIIAKNDSPILAFFKRHTLLSFCEGTFSINSEFEIALLSYFIKLNIWLCEYHPKII